MAGEIQRPSFSVARYAQDLADGMRANGLVVQ